MHSSLYPQPGNCLVIRTWTYCDKDWWRTQIDGELEHTVIKHTGNSYYCLWRWWKQLPAGR